MTSLGEDISLSQPPSPSERVVITKAATPKPVRRISTGVSMDTEKTTTALPGMAGVEETLGDLPRDRNPLPSPPEIKAGEHEVVENSFGDRHDADEIARSESNEIASNEKKSNQSNPDELAEDANAELEAFYTILLEAFQEVDADQSEVVTAEQLGTILDALQDDGVLNYYDPSDLELLASDMDTDGTGYISQKEYVDVLFRREQGYIIHENHLGERNYVFIGEPPVDFSEKEILEAFQVFDVERKEAFGAREIRAVMKAVSDIDVSAFEANKMIEAASGGASDTITFDEFKAILFWVPPEDDFDSHE